MTNRQLAYLMLTSTFLAFLAYVVTPYYYDVSEILYTLAGFGYLVFGTWLAYKVIKQ